MQFGDYLVMIISGLLTFVVVADTISRDGFQGFAYTLGMCIGAFLVYAIIGFVLLFAFRYVRDHYWRK
jgi:threonine/homoserine/homoserine lactone efflux protein